MAETGAQREAKRKAKLKENGYIRCEFWIKPEWKPFFLRLIAKLKAKLLN